MDFPDIISGIKKEISWFAPLSISQEHTDEICLKVGPEFFRETCLALHKILPSPVMMLFAADERAKTGKFIISCVFVDYKKSRWVRVSMDIAQEDPWFDSLAKAMHSAALFEREIYEMFGIEPKGNPDLRRLNLHDEVWPPGNFPLRKDFKFSHAQGIGEYKFSKVEGEGIFEVPVGPVHAGIIGPGHFRFSSAGEPIINLEIRLGFTHRGIEKLFEGKDLNDALRLAERVSGDSAFAHSLSFVRAAEKICGIDAGRRVDYLRGIFLELERMYNHVNDIGGMAVDVGFSFPAAYAAIIKEAILSLNEKISGSRYLKGVNICVGQSKDLDENARQALADSIEKILRDFKELVKILDSSVSFMDRVDTTGSLKRKTAEDLGIVGLAARACGIPTDLRKYFPGIYRQAQFQMALEQSGDCLARFRLRVREFEESARLIGVFLSRMDGEKNDIAQASFKQGSALGYVEGWRGPVLYWLKTDERGLIERCKIVDASYHNWQGLSYAVLGNIIPDFPLCNKSFDLSYSGNDL